jgi:hypothetical protein
MNEEQPPFDENDPEEALRYYRQKLMNLVVFIRSHPDWGGWIYVYLLIVAILIVALHASLYPMSLLVTLKVISYGIVPSILALAGDHFAAEAIPEPKRRRMYRAFFLLCATLGILLIAVLENKSDREHQKEVDTMDKKVELVQKQNNEILMKVSPPEQDAGTKEVVRRQSILALLRNEYILTHKDVSTGMIDGSEALPSQWVNKRLEQLGESWLVGYAVQPRTMEQPRTEVIPDLGQMGLTSTQTSTFSPARLRGALGYLSSLFWRELFCSRLSALHAT